MNQSYHNPVMLNETLNLLNIGECSTVIDGTIGMGGHTRAILNAYKDVRVIGFDRDAKSLELAAENLREFGDRVKLIHGRFSTAEAQVKSMMDSPCIQGILLDLGISSRQLDDPSYGLSFRNLQPNTPLDMRLDDRCDRSAKDILNAAGLEELADIFYYYADYTPARRLARAIVNSRPLNQLGDLIKLCEQIGAGGRVHPATKPLMALRMVVNDELGELKEGLTSLSRLLEPQGRMVVISFHSGEDRIVKHFFRLNHMYTSPSKKPFIPSREECKNNPRSRSAKLRMAIKV